MSNLVRFLLILSVPLRHECHKWFTYLFRPDTFFYYSSPPSLAWQMRPWLGTENVRKAGKGPRNNTNRPPESIEDRWGIPGVRSRYSRVKKYLEVVSNFSTVCILDNKRWTSETRRVDNIFPPWENTLMLGQWQMRDTDRNLSASNIRTLPCCWEKSLLFNFLTMLSLYI